MNMNKNMNMNINVNSSKGMNVSGGFKKDKESIKTNSNGDGNEIASGDAKMS